MYEHMMLHRLARVKLFICMQSVSSMLSHVCHLHASQTAKHIQRHAGLQAPCQNELSSGVYKLFWKNICSAIMGHWSLLLQADTTTKMVHLPCMCTTTIQSAFKWLLAGINLSLDYNFHILIAFSSVYSKLSVMSMKYSDNADSLLCSCD